MKKQHWILLALVAMTAGLNADQQAAATQPATAAVAQPVATAQAASKLSTDEQAFAAKLNEQNRKAYEGFSAEQKKAAMAATCASCGKAALSANEAVQKQVQNVAASEKPAAATTSTSTAK